MVQTAAMKNTLVTAYQNAAVAAALYTTAPGATAGTEPTGGAPAYARKALSTLWGSPVNGSGTCTVTFDVPAGTTVVGAGLHSATSGGSYLDGGSVNSQTFTTQGQFILTIVYVQS